MAVQDLIKIGDLYGRWKIIGLPYKSNKRWYTKCKCTCGSEIEKDVRIDQLVNGHSRSCGCLLKEHGYRICKKRKKQNKYDLSGDYGIGYTNNIDYSDPEHKRNYFYFDLKDYNLIKDFCWCFDKDGYLFTMCDYHNIKMHRLIMNCPDDMEVDHIKHNNYDNRKNELRICTHTENAQNRKSVNNTSGIQGVKYNKNTNKWIAFLTIKREYVLLQSFDSFEEAVKARKEAENKYFGEYSYDNSMSMDTKNKEAIDI